MRRSASRFACDFTPCRMFALAAVLSAPVVGRAQSMVDARYCEAPVIRREVLRNERGDPLYVSPDAMLARDGELLLAGQFSVGFVRNGANAYDASMPNEVLAVIRRRDGAVVTFPRFATDEMVPTAVRAASLDVGEWGVLVHAERTGPDGRSEGSGALWFATLTHSGWGAVEKIPLPPHIVPSSSLARQMVLLGDRLIAAMPADSAAGASGVLLVERQRGRWRTRFLNTDVASYTALARDGATGELVLGVVRSDLTQSNDGNSLFLMYPDRSASASRLLVRGGKSPVHHPEMHGTARGLSIAWRVYEQLNGGFSRTAVMAIVDPEKGLVIRRIVAEPVRVSTVSGREALAIVSASAQSAGSMAVTLHTLPAPSEGVRLHYSSTFAEVFGATRWSESEIAVSLLAAAKDGDYLVNEILWIGTRCGSAGKGVSATDTASSYRSPHHVQTFHSSRGVAAVRERLPD